MKKVLTAILSAALAACTLFGFAACGSAGIDKHP